LTHIDTLEGGMSGGAGRSDRLIVPAAGAACSNTADEAPAHSDLVVTQQGASQRRHKLARSQVSSFSLQHAIEWDVGKGGERAAREEWGKQDVRENLCRISAFVEGR